MSKRTFSTQAGGSDARLKVGVGSATDINWFNIQYPFLRVSDGATNYGMWTPVSDQQGSIHLLGGGDFEANDTAPGSNAIRFLPDFDNGGTLRFNSGKQTIFQTVVLTEAVTGANEGGVGFAVFGAAQIFSAQGSNTTSVGFVRDTAGVWYARTANGAAFTETAITITDSVSSVLRCEYDGANATPQVRFYVDGGLVATITTTVPSAVGSAIGFGAGNVGSSMTAVGCPAFAVEI